MRARWIATGTIALALGVLGALLFSIRRADRPILPATLMLNLFGGAGYQTPWRCQPSGLRTWRTLWQADRFCSTERRVGRLLDAADIERDPQGHLVTLGRVWALGENRRYADATRDSIMAALLPWVTTGRPCPLAQDQPPTIARLPTAEARGWALPGYDVIIHTSVARGLWGPSYGVSVQVIAGGVYGCGLKRRAA